MSIDRRQLILTGAALAASTPAWAQAVQQEALPPVGGQAAPGVAPTMPPPNTPAPGYPAAEPFERAEIVQNVSDFFGVTAEAAAAAIEKVFRDNGQPTGYMAGEEASGAFGVGVRYGKGLLYMKNRGPETVFWQGPSVGFDFGGNASRVFTLCYNLQYPDALFRRYPGVEGSAYLAAGMGVNYQKAEDITLAPIRAGVGVRLGANIGYLAYSRRRNWLPV
jgi:hypothetical protein